MKPILAIVHVYYPELWPELMSCLKNITCPYDLYVTTVEKNRLIEKEILAFYPKAHFEIIENLGYDVGPFFHVINRINLDNYSYIIKLHTKRDMRKLDGGFRGMDVDKWRNNLLYFLKSKDIFAKYLAVFEQNPKIGMQAKGDVIVSYRNNKELNTMLLSFLRERNLEKIKFNFVAGTMFMARTDLFKDMQKLSVSMSDFHAPTESHKTQQAHVFERLFGYFAYKNNYVVVDGLLPHLGQGFFARIFIYGELLYRIKRFFFQKKITRSGKLCIKICKIPVSFLFRNKQDKP